MAYEFIAPITAEEVPFLALAERLQNTGICVMESATANEARLRWPDTERKEHWPEDAELSLYDHGLLVTVHAGTKQQRSALLEALTAIASDLLGESVAFTET